jgi:hypothetical protein
MSQILSKDRYVEAFKKHVCPVCRLCDSKTPAFCMTVYGGAPDRFWEIIRYVNAVRLLKAEIVSSFYTFEGFCGLFCNSQKQCPNRNKECKELKKVFDCYEAFADQCGASIDAEIKADIWKSFSGIDIKQIGKDFQLPTKNPLKAVAKKRRKKVNQLIKRAKNGYKRELQLAGFVNVINMPVKEKKPIKTTFFCNDDEEWKGMIDTYLKRATNNRQPTANARSAGGT